MTKRRPQFMFDVSVAVRHVSHDREHDRFIGIITAREWYENTSGGGAFYYVRWINPEGRPADDAVRFAEWELQLYPRPEE